MHNPHTCVIKQGFSRELRLLTPDQFRFVFEQPSRASTPTITILSRPTKLDVPRLGLTVAKNTLNELIVVIELNVSVVKVFV